MDGRIGVNKVPWKMVGRWAVTEEIAGAIADAFGAVESFVFACLFSGHGTGYQMVGRGPVSNHINILTCLHLLSCVSY